MLPRRCLPNILPQSSQRSWSSDEWPIAELLKGDLDGYLLILLLLILILLLFIDCHYFLFNVPIFFAQWYQWCSSLNSRPKECIEALIRVTMFFFAVPNAVANLLDLARGWGIRLKAGKLKRSRDSKWRIPRLKLQFFPSSLRTVLGTEAFY